MKTYKNIIGITGKPGSGKTCYAEYISKATGIEVISFDNNLKDLLNLPIIKPLLGDKSKKTNIKASDLLSTYEADGLLKKIEIELLKTISNQLLKNLANSNEKPFIVDFCFLPELNISKKFGENYLIEGNDKLRFSKMSVRDSIEIDTAKRIDALVSKIVSYDKLKYNAIIKNNDYESIPKELQDLISKLNLKYGIMEMKSHAK